ncbi:MAG: TlpA disulfide reductase family protein [Proteobacteria bacterium]|nr:TlpA disulfide reductase family protein [Pseudomonadota bacterium]
MMGERPDLCSSAVLKIGLFVFSLFVSTAFSAPINKFVPWGENPAPPTLNVTTLKGEATSLKKFLGKVVILNFWATWCAPCLKEIPSLLALKRRLPAKYFAVVFVNYGESKTQIEKKWAEIGEGEITLIDPGAQNIRAWIDIGLPTTVVLNQDHKIVYKIVGDIDWSQPDIVSIIKSIR